MKMHLCQGFPNLSAALRPPAAPSQSADTGSRFLSSRQPALLSNHHPVLTAPPHMTTNVPGPARSGKVSPKSSQHVLSVCRHNPNVSFPLPAPKALPASGLTFLSGHLRHLGSATPPRLGPLCPLPVCAAPRRLKLPPRHNSALFSGVDATPHCLHPTPWGVFSRQEFCTY